MKYLLNFLKQSDRTLPRLLTLLMLGVTIAYIIQSGLLELGISRWFDGRFFYAAGRSWLNGTSPYDTAAFARYWQEGVGSRSIGAFVYPPTLAFLAIPLALFPWSIAKWVLDATNLLALFGIGFFTFKLTISHPSIGKHSPMPLFFVMLSGWVASSPVVIHLGQMGLIALCGLLGAFYAQQRQRPILCAAFVLLATFKPQITLIPLIYLLFISSRRFLIPSLSAFAVGIFSILAFLPPSLAELPGQLLSSYSRYRDRLLQIKLHYASASGLLGETDFAGMAMLVGFLLGLALALGLAYLYRQTLKRQHLDPGRSIDGASGLAVQADLLRHLQILLSAVAALLPVYHYDLVLYIPLIGTLPIVQQRTFILPLLGLLAIASRHNNVETVLGRILGESHSPFFINYLTGFIFLVVLAIWLLQRRNTIPVSISEPSSVTSASSSRQMSRTSAN